MSPIDQFTRAQLDLAARHAPDWTLQDVERVERPMVQRRPARVSAHQSAGWSATARVLWLVGAVFVLALFVL